MLVDRGYRETLKNEKLEVVIQTAGRCQFDVSCFGIDAAEKLSDDRYMVFYNQPSSPRGEIRMDSNGNETAFTVSLSELPGSIAKLVFTVNTDADSGMTMRSTDRLCVKIGELEMQMSGSDFSEEKAVIACEIYKRNQEWKVNMVGRGFNGGLSALLQHFGGVEITDAPESHDKKTKVSLEKKLEAQAPKLVSLAKPIKVSLEKHKLSQVEAKVALVLDLSGSMNQRYKSGAVQRIVNKTLPLAIQFDDDGSMDFWYFGTTCKKMEDITLKNYETATESWKQVQAEIGGSNYEPAILQQVFDTFRNSKMPAYVLFVTDGGIREKAAIKKLITEASEYPIFWQFMGVGGKNYSILENLDTMEGRIVDNANFFAIDDFDEISNEELYDRLLREFPVWLKEATSKGIVK